MEKFEKVHDRKTLERVSELDARCFGDGDGDFEKLSEATEIHGDVFSLTRNGRLLGYAIYGQVWLPKLHDAYITRIGVHPQHRQLGYGFKMLNAILSDLSNRPECPAVYGDIRKSNIASQKLFRKAGFHVHCELDGIYMDEIGIRVTKTLQGEIDEKPNERSARIRTRTAESSSSTSRKEESTGS